MRTLEISDAQHTVRQVSLRTWLLLLHSCNTTQNCQSVAGGDIVVLRVVPVLSQDAQHILCVPVFILQSHQRHVCHTLRRTIVAPCTSRHEDAPETFPSFIFRQCGHVRPSLSSFRLEDETANVTDDGLARFDSSLARVLQGGLERVITRSLFGQLICPLVASSHKATSLIQLGSLRFRQVCLAFRH